MKKTHLTDQWTRREFTVESVLAMLGGVAITVSGCGDSGSSPSSPSTPSPSPTPPPVANPGDVSGTITANHGHRAVITRGQLDAGNALMSFDITGTADHGHTVSLSANEVGQIAAGTRVAKVSSNDVAHAHTVTFN